MAIIKKYQQNFVDIFLVFMLQNAKNYKYNINFYKNID